MMCVMCSPWNVCRTCLFLPEIIFSRNVAVAWRSFTICASLKNNVFMCPVFSYIFLRQTGCRVTSVTKSLGCSTFKTTGTLCDYSVNKLYARSTNNDIYVQSGLLTSDILPLNLVDFGGLRRNLTSMYFSSSSELKAAEQSSSSTSVRWDTLSSKEGKIDKLYDAKNELIYDIKETKDKVKDTFGRVIERENVWTIPNMLCVSRLLLSPVLCYMVLASNYSWSLGLFVVAGITDLLDGWIARTFPRQSSKLGSFLDPLADKTLVACLFLSLTYNGLIPLPLTALIIYRDILIIVGASYVRYKSLPYPRTLNRYFDATHVTAELAPTFISKVNTAIQLSLITTSLAAPVFGFLGHPALQILWWTTALSTVSSGISYIFSNDTYKLFGQSSQSSDKVK